MNNLRKYKCYSLHILGKKCKTKNNLIIDVDKLQSYSSNENQSKYHDTFYTSRNVDVIRID